MASSAAALDRGRLIELLEASGALTHGHFLLSSGRHSRSYVQCARLLERPAVAAEVGRALAAELAELEPEAVVAPALGGLLIGYEVARALDLPFRFVERHGGEMALRRGFAVARDERLVVVEDVVTTGLSVRETEAALRALGGRVVGVGAIVDRAPSPPSFEVPFVALARLEIDSWETAECPLCAAGAAPEKPGSRPGPV